MAAIVPTSNRANPSFSSIIHVLEDKRTNASQGTALVCITGAKTAYLINQEEFMTMQELSQAEEMGVNRALAKQFIIEHLAIVPTTKNIETLAKCIFELEHAEANLCEEQ